MHRYTEAEPNLMKYYGFWWEFKEQEDVIKKEKKYVLSNGPLCVRKGCLATMTNYELKKYKCSLCGYKTEVDIESSELRSKAHESFRANERKKISVVLDLDKLPGINEKLEEENKFYSVTIEHDKVGNPKDIHILIGRRDNNGKHAHIILSPDAEIRTEKKGLPPEAEIKSISYIVYK